MFSIQLDNLRIIESRLFTITGMIGSVVDGKIEEKNYLQIVKSIFGIIIKLFYKHRSKIVYLQT